MTFFVLTCKPDASQSICCDLEKEPAQVFRTLTLVQAAASTVVGSPKYQCGPSNGAVSRLVTVPAFYRPDPTALRRRWSLFERGGVSFLAPCCFQFFVWNVYYPGHALADGGIPSNTAGWLSSILMAAGSVCCQSYRFCNTLLIKKSLGLWPPLTKSGMGQTASS